MKLTDMTLISGAPIDILGVCTIRQPKLEIFKALDGELRYKQASSLLLMSTQDFVQALGMEESFENLPDTEVEKITPLYLMSSLPQYSSVFIRALSFFVIEEIQYSYGKFCFMRGDTLVPLTEEVYTEIQSCITTINCIQKHEEEKGRKFSSAKAQKIWEKIQKGRQMSGKTKKETDPSLSLENVISVVASSNCGYTLNNIWELTIYQLYDQFSRLNVKNQVDAFTHKWSVWGKEDFDWSLWCKPLGTNK